MSKVIRWGILGAGRIARKFASDLQLVDDAVLVAVGSRSQETADAFAKEFNIPNKHSSYAALVNDDEVDVIYIATPHNLHYENTLLCLQHGKAVLCEKPFAINSRQAADMIAVAKQKGVFLMDALWTRFHPHYEKVCQLLEEKLLGDIKAVLINFGFKATSPIPERLFDSELGGGTILDIGIYNVFMAMTVLGKPDGIQATITPSSSGVDEQCAILFTYKNGAMAQLFSTFSSNLGTEADICGTEGRIRLTTRFYEPSTSIEYYPERVDSRQVIPVEKEAGFGYQYEARHVNDCLKKGLTESPLLSHAHTLALMQTLDEIRRIAGVHYADDAV